jgi:hypothetical protein
LVELVEDARQGVGRDAAPDPDTDTRSSWPVLSPSILTDVPGGAYLMPLVSRFAKI